jgi:hypothetical protein
LGLKQKYNLLVGILIWSVVLSGNLLKVPLVKIKKPLPKWSGFLVAVGGGVEPPRGS